MALSLSLPHSQSCDCFEMPVTPFVLASCARVRSAASMTVSARAAHTHRSRLSRSLLFSIFYTKAGLRSGLHFISLPLALTIRQQPQPWQTPGAYHSAQPCRPKRSALAAKKPPPNHAAAAKTSHTARLSASKPTGLPTRSSAVRSRTSLSVLRLANAAWSLSFLARPSRGSCGQPW